MKKVEESKIERLVSYQKKDDKYILDEENAILVRKRNGTSGYAMMHERLVNNELITINCWSLNSYKFGPNNPHIKELNLFKVQGMGNYKSDFFDSIYDYKNDKFIIPKNIWEGIDSSYLEEYNGFLAYFSISSDYEEDDVYSWHNPITNEQIIRSHCIYDSNYYAMLNIDGTIRENKLFKGDSFSEITDIIDLSNYKSLDEFKKQRKELCNKEKEIRKKKYLETKPSNNTPSPYLDEAVEKILKLKK